MLLFDPKKEVGKTDAIAAGCHLSSRSYFARVIEFVAAIILIGMSGCITYDQNSLRRFANVIDYGSPDMIAVRKTPRNHLVERLKWLSKSAPKPSARTDQILRQYDFFNASPREPQLLLTRLAQSIQTDPTLDKLYAFSELTNLNAQKAVAVRDDSTALDLFGAAVMHSSMYLFDDRFDDVRNAYDPAFHEMRKIYNSSLEGMLRVIFARGEIQPGNVHNMQIAGEQYDISIVMRGPWRDDEFERIEFVADYEVTGLGNRHETFGLGVPLIAVRRKPDVETPAERFYPDGLTFPVTAFLRALPSGRRADGGMDNVKRFALELYDPLVTRSILVNGHRATLQSDLSTPLAFYLNDPVIRTSAVATFALLNADFAKQLKGLYMLEPYRPDKIPVVMIHGLWSSPVTWMEMFNDLRAMPEIRDNYQFWFYLYPTGQPFWVSAQDMREDLASARRILDADGRSPALNEMVLVGHSMGGLVAELQTIDSGRDFWGILSDQPFQRLVTNENTRTQLERTLFFRADPSIRRVVTIATPHRGSHIANGATEWLSRALFTIPGMLALASEQLIRDNPNYFRDTKLLSLSTSIDSMDPDCPMLPVMLQAQRPSWVKYHNVVGMTPKSSYASRISSVVAGEGDGVVSLASAKLENVESEIVVEAEHMTVHQHPGSILEVRRILLEHLTEVRAEQTALRRNSIPRDHWQSMPDDHGPSR